MSRTHMNVSHIARIALSSPVSPPTPCPATGLRAHARRGERAGSANARQGSGRLAESGGCRPGFALDFDKIDGEGCVIIKREGLRSSPPVDMEAPYAAKDEFESLQESMHPTTVSSSRVRACARFGLVPDRIREAHEP